MQRVMLMRFIVFVHGRRTLGPESRCGIMLSCVRVRGRRFALPGFGDACRHADDEINRFTKTVKSEKIDFRQTHKTVLLFFHTILCEEKVVKIVFDFMHNTYRCI